MSTITWLHLSDLHFRAEEQHTWDENIVLKALLTDISERREQDALRPDFIVVTGDIAFSGKSAEYDLARGFFDDLLKTTDLEKERLFLVPGNHDVDRRLVSRGAQVVTDSLADREDVNIILSNHADRALVLARFRGYANFINNYLTDHQPFDDEKYFYVRTLCLDGRQIAVVGLNSAWASASELDEAQRLLVGERQVRTALKAAESVDMKLALLHHPLDLLRPFDRNDVEPLLFNNFRFVLHGHMHQTGVLETRTPDSEAVTVAAGACYATRRYPNSYNFVRLDFTMDIGTIYLRRYSDKQGGFWAKDTLSYRNVRDGKHAFSLHKSPISSPSEVAQSAVRSIAAQQLPSDIADFVDRQDELRDIVQFFQEPLSPRETAVRVCAIAGMAGVGKSALAIHASHCLKDHYPDAQLYANMRGTDDPHLHPTDVLTGFLRLLGVPSHDIPKDSEGQSRLYRALLSDRRVLVLLDNVQDEKQVRPLLPGSPTNVVLITSREPLSALEGARSLKLHPMTETSGLALLSRLVGNSRVSAEPESADRIIRLCGGLPLAIRIIGGRLQNKPHWQLQDCALRLADKQRRLEQLQLKDLDIRASFALSHQALTSEDVRLFCSLGLLASPSFVLEVAAALVNAESDATWDSLERLVDLQLLEPVDNERYRFHDLVHLFAQENFGKAPEGLQQSARLRAVQWYTKVSATMSEALKRETRYQEIQTLVQDFARSGTTSDQTVTGTLAWFEIEQPNLIAAVRWAHQAEAWDLAWQLAANLTGFLCIRGSWNDWEKSHDLALDAATRSGNLRGQATILTTQGMVYRLQGRWDEASVMLGKSLSLRQVLGDLAGEGLTRAELGIVLQLQGHWDEAFVQFEKSKSVYQYMADWSGLSMALSLLGNLYRLQGHWDEAVAMLEESLRINQEQADRHGESIILNLLGNIYRLQGLWKQSEKIFGEALRINKKLANRQGQEIALASLGHVYRSQEKWSEATEAYEKSLLIAQELDDVRGKAIIFNSLGIIHRALGDWDQAVVRFQEGLRINQALGERRGEGITLNLLASVYRLQGQWNAAIKMYEQNLKISQELGDRRGQAIALGGLGNVYRLQGRWDQAIRVYEESLSIAEALGDPYSVGISVNNLALVHCMQEDWNTATAMAQKGLRINRELGNQRGESIALRILGNACAGEQMWDQALDHLGESLRIAHEIEDRRCQAQTLDCLGRAHVQLAQLGEGLRAFEEAGRLFQEMKDDHGQGLVLRNMGILYQRKGQAPTSVKTWHEALTLLNANSPEYQQVMEWIKVESGES